MLTRGRSTTSMARRACKPEEAQLGALSEASTMDSHSNMRRTYSEISSAEEILSRASSMKRTTSSSPSEEWVWAWEALAWLEATKDQNRTSSNRDNKIPLAMMTSLVEASVALEAWEASAEALAASETWVASEAASVEICSAEAGWEAEASLPSQPSQVVVAPLSQSRPRPSSRTARGLLAQRRPLLTLKGERPLRSRTR